MVEYVGKPFKVVDIEVEDGVERIEEGQRLKYTVVDTGEMFDAFVHKIGNKDIEFSVLNEHGTRKYSVDDIALILEGDDA